MVKVRFCPTPSGHLHHGNMYMALLNQEFARRHGGSFEVQIDDFFDLFPPPELIEAFLEDMEWLEICPRERVLFHDAHRGAYLRMLDALEAQGKAKIRREEKGACLSKVEIRRGEEALQIEGVQASSSHPGIAGYLTFAAHPRHLIDDHWTQILGQASNWVHDTFWASDPREQEPWIEFVLAAGSRPEEVRLTYWRPQPEETEVLVRQQGGEWRRAAQRRCAPERIGEIRWAAYIPPKSVRPVVMELAPEAVAGGVERVRLVFRGMQQTESYEFCAPEGCETVRYEDLVLGEREIKRTQAAPFLFFQFARAANDVVLETTHLIRGDELEGEMNFYAQCFYVMGRPLPVMCHVPHLVDETGEKLSKSLSNADRITTRLRAQGMSPAQARAWIIENAYKQAARRGEWHSFEGQLARLAQTVKCAPAREARPQAGPLKVSGTTTSQANPSQ